MTGVLQPRVASLVMALVSAFAPGQRQGSEPPPILVQGAMTIEVRQLAAHLEHATEEHVGDWIFWRGTVDGYPVVVEKTQKGVANAAAATAIAIETYHPAAIVNQGTAGGHDPSLHTYDIVVGTTAISIAAWRAPFREAGKGSNPLDWRPMDLTAADGSASNDPNARRVAKFDADVRLLEAARAASKSYTRGHIVEGTIGSSDMWIDELDLIERYHRDFGTSAEEMETAPAAQIAHEFHVPFVGIRVLSDNVTNGGSYDPKTADACQDFVLQVIKAYIASHR